MRIITEEYTVYTWSSATDEVREKIRESLTGDGSLYEHNFQERIATLRKFSELLQADLGYSISVVPDRGEFISLKPRYLDFNYDALWAAIDVEKECPLTGVCYDHDLIDHLSKYNLTDDALKNAFDEYIKSIHEEWESMCGNEYLKDLCEANGYEFYSNGSIYI